MTSWFNFSSTVVPMEDTNSVSRISNLEETISNLDGTVNNLKALVFKLIKRQRFLQQQVETLMDNVEIDEEYDPMTSYRFIIDTISIHMTKVQLENNTTRQDISDFETRFDYKPKDKLDFAYCFLMTIARKAIQENHTEFNFVLNSSNKLSAGAQQAFIVNRRVKNRANCEWEDFICDYQHNELIIE